MKVWRPVPESSRHEARDDGVIRVIGGRILKTRPRGEYLIVNLTLSTKVEITRSLHRVICSAFHPNPDDLPEVNHKDGYKLNNNAKNLEWCTESYNRQHAFDIGLQIGVRGELSHLAHIPDDHIDQIRTMYATGNFLQCELGEIFNTCQSNISQIVRRKRRCE